MNNLEYIAIEEAVGKFKPSDKIAVRYEFGEYPFPTTIKDMLNARERSPVIAKNWSTLSVRLCSNYEITNDTISTASTTDLVKLAIVTIIKLTGARDAADVLH